jgi:hypothetical protein
VLFRGTIVCLVATIPLLGCVELEVTDSNGALLVGFSVTLASRGDSIWRSQQFESEGSDILLGLGVERHGVIVVMKEGYHPGIGIAIPIERDDVRGGLGPQQLSVPLTQADDCIVAGSGGSTPSGSYVPGEVLVGLNDFLVGDEQTFLFEQYCLDVGDPVDHQGFSVWIDNIDGDVSALTSDLYAQELGFLTTLRSHPPFRGQSWLLLNIRSNTIPQDELENTVYRTLNRHKGIELLEVVRKPKSKKIFVPIGRELAWINLLEQHPAIRYAQLNYILDPF